MPLQKSGKSCGVRDVTRLPSITTGSSTKVIPALIISSLIAIKHVAVLPFNTFAETSNEPA